MRTSCSASGAHFALVSCICLSESNGFILSVPARSIEQPRSLWKLTWNTSSETAEGLMQRLSRSHSGDGFFVHLHIGIGESISFSSGIDFVDCYPSPGWGQWVTWAEGGGMLHSVIANVRPDIALGIELAPYEHSSQNHDPEVGVFLLQSPGHSMWRVMAWSMRQAWQMGELSNARVHVLVHALQDWSPPSWREVLKEAAPILGGFHWCEGHNRYPTINPELVRQREMDNYYNKVFVMVEVARARSYDFVVSLDDDIMLSPSTISALITSGPASDAFGCGLVAPLTQNGIPSTELWARTFLSDGDVAALFKCYAESSGNYCGERCCWPEKGVQERIHEIPLPWDAIEWHKTLARKERMSTRRLHPVLGNLTCMKLALSLALQQLPKEWGRWDIDLGLLVDSNQSYAYFANNAFAMRTDRYREVLRHPTCCENTDESALNSYLQEEKLPLCFLGNSFGIHPAWSAAFGQATKLSLEEEALQVFLHSFEWKFALHGSSNNFFVFL